MLTTSGRSDNPLLVVVDMQRVYAEPDSPWCVPDFDALIGPIDRLVAAFGDRVVFTRFLVPRVPTGGWIDYYKEWSFVCRPSAAPLFDLVAHWAGSTAPMIDKSTFSSFGPELRDLAGEGNALVLCGVSTECCVLATAIDAVDAGIPVRIVADACASVDEAAHKGALHVASVGFSPMITVTTVDKELARANMGP